MQITTLPLNVLIYIIIIAFIIILFVQGTIDLNLTTLKTFFAPLGIVTTVVTIFDKVFEKYWWHFPLFKGWCVKRPDIRGTWHVLLKSDWVDPDTGKKHPDIEAYVYVKQTLKSLHMRLMTQESRSRLITHSINVDADGTYTLTAVYINEPKIEFRGEKSEIHYGALLLEIINEHSIEGNYWTDRKTTGFMKFTRITYNTFESFELAKKEHDRLIKDAEMRYFKKYFSPNHGSFK
jgi:hypothetical protein